MLSLKDFKSSKFQMFEKSQLSDLTNIIGGDIPMSSHRSNGLLAGDIADHTPLGSGGAQWDNVQWLTHEHPDFGNYDFP